MIKNELVSYQYFASKRSKEQITNLKKAIEELKNETPQNWDLIETVEKRLDIIVDTELRAEIEKNSKFEILNAEKITPHFVKLAKVGGGARITKRNKR
jgi:DNA repair exonuclease SbcCD ATPase subunit